MNIIQEIKEAKLKCLANEMNDLAKYIRETTSDGWIGDHLDEFAKAIHEVLNISDGHIVSEKTLDIREIENSIYIDYPRHIIPEGYKDMAKRQVEGNLIDYIKKNKLIKVKEECDDHGMTIVTASLYVGIRPQIHLQSNNREL